MQTMVGLYEMFFGWNWCWCSNRCICESRESELHKRLQWNHHQPNFAYASWQFHTLQTSTNQMHKVLEDLSPDALPGSPGMGLFLSSPSTGKNQGKINFLRIHSACFFSRPAGLTSVFVVCRVHSNTGLIQLMTSKFSTLGPKNYSLPRLS